MAKKRGGGGSNLGLIITLIFFVLTTVILGVTTYMGYSDIDTKVKEKAEADKAKAVADADAKYYRMQVRVLRPWIGFPANGVDAAEVAREKKEFDNKQFAAANNQKDRDEVEKLFKALDQKMPWDASKDTSPQMSYEQRVGTLSAEVDAWKLKTKKAEEAVKRAEADKTDLEATKDKEIAALRTSIEDLRKATTVKQQVDLNSIAEQQAKAAEEGKKRAALESQKDAAATAARKLNGQIGELKSGLAKATKEIRELRDERDELRTRLTAVYEKTGIDANSVEASTLDATARKVLENWNKSWRVVELDKRGEMPFVSLGTADGITPEVTFSIHSVGPNGKLNPNPKGTLEIVRVMGANMSQARVTSIKDQRKDPIVRGDRLFNPTWDPNRMRHVAIAGIVDLGGDGTDGSEDLRRLLKRQKVVVDAYIDTTSNKAPKLIGKGITTGKDGTDYLIIGQSLDAVRHPKSKDKDYAARYDSLISKLKSEAANSGVALISLRRYLDMIGYQPPKIISNANGNNP